MKLINAPDDPTITGLTQRMTSENGLVEIGIHSVAFGSRIRAGFVGMPYSEIDWHCGSSQKHLDAHLIAVCLYLMRRDETHDCFDGLPKTSRVVPCWLDDVFERELTQAMLTMPDVKERGEVKFSEN